jgi:hypothetical protein
VLDLYSQSSTAWISYGIADPFDIHHNHGIADTNVPINLITNLAIFAQPLEKV